jgi:mannose-1-phosphate guanylyltransferase
MLCVEPSRRDTAAAITLGCARIAGIDPDADALVLPADTLLDPPRALADGVALARGQAGYREAIHVFGVKPARAEGGFGYIQPGASVANGVSAVAGFKEKPGPEQAAKLIQQGGLWNIGTFLFSLATFDRELQQHLPQLSGRLRKAPSQHDYEGLPKVSIDYGLIEKCSNLRVVNLHAAFDDIGTWDALLTRPGWSGTALQTVGGTGNQLIADGATVAVVGESDLLVVVNKGKVLVLKRGHGQDVKQVKE